MYFPCFLFIFSKISLWEYNLYRNKNNQKPYMIDYGFWLFFRCKGDVYGVLRKTNIERDAYSSICYKNPNKPSCIDLILTNKPQSF